MFWITQKLKPFKEKLEEKTFSQKSWRLRESNIAISLKANCHRRKKLIKLQNFSSDIFFLWLFLPLNYSRCSFVTLVKTSEQLSVNWNVQVTVSVKVFGSLRIIFKTVICFNALWLKLLWIFYSENLLGNCHYCGKLIRKHSPEQ